MLGTIKGKSCRMSTITDKSTEATVTQVPRNNLLKDKHSHGRLEDYNCLVSATENIIF